MKGIFSPDSRLMQALNALSNAVILNLLFILCSIPVVTFGASLSALYTATRKLDGSYPVVKVFFLTFRGNLKRMIPAWLVTLVLAAAFGLSMYSGLRYDIPHFNVMFYTALVLLVVDLCVSAVAPLFYSVFECTFGQLMRNVLRLVIAWPIRSLLVGAFTFLPLLVNVLFGPTVLVQFSPILLLFYFAGVALLCAWIYKMPITICRQQFFPEEEEEEGAEEPDAPEEDPDGTDTQNK